MSDEVIKQVPQLLENPVLVMQSLTVANRITVLGEVYTKEGKPVLAALELKPKGKNGQVLNLSKIASAYSKNNLQNLINTSDVLYVNPDKKRTDTWLKDVQGLQLPTSLTKYGSIGKITYVNKDVKGVIKDNSPGGETAFEIAIKEALSKKESKVKTAKEVLEDPRFSEKPRFSIKTDEQGLPYVKIDKDILEGVEKEDWGRVTREVLKSKYVDGVEVGGRNIGVNSKSRNEFTNSKHSQYLGKVKPSLLADKFKIADNLDELLKVIEYNYELPKHIRKDNITGFYRGSATIEIGGKDYSAHVITAKLKTGDEIFYDVVSMKQTKIDRKKEVSQSVPHKKNGTLVKETSFYKNIPQKNDGVNKESKVKTAKEVLEDPRFSRKKTVRGGAKAEARIKEVSENNGAAKENVLSFEEIPKKAQEYYNKKISSIVNEICKDFGILYFDKASVKTQLSELALDIFENDTIDVAHERKIFESISNSSSEGDNESLKEYYAQALKEISMASDRVKKYQKETLRGSEDLGLIDKKRLDLAYVQKDRAQKALDGIDKKNLLSAKEKHWALSIAKRLDYGNNAPTGVIVDYANALKQKDDATNVITAYNTQRKQELLAEAILATENSEVWKDKQAGLLYARETQERNIMDIAKNDKEGAKLVKETYFDPVHKNEALGQQFIREYRQKVKKLNLTEAESVLVQAYGENIIDEIMLD